MPLQSSWRVARPLPPVLVHDRLSCDVGRLELRGGVLVPTDFARHLQVLPLLIAGDILARLLRQDDLRIRAFENCLATRRGQVAELLRGVELFLREVLGLAAVASPLRIVRTFHLVASTRHFRELIPIHTKLAILCLIA